VLRPPTLQTRDRFPGRTLRYLTLSEYGLLPVVFIEVPAFSWKNCRSGQEQFQGSRPTPKFPEWNVWGNRQARPLLAAHRELPAERLPRDIQERRLVWQAGSLCPLFRPQPVFLYLLSGPVPGETGARGCERRPCRKRLFTRFRGGSYRGFESIFPIWAPGTRAGVRTLTPARGAGWGRRRPQS